MGWKKLSRNEETLSVICRIIFVFPLNTSERLQIGNDIEPNEMKTFILFTHVVARTRILDEDFWNGKVDQTLR